MIIRTVMTMFDRLNRLFHSLLLVFILGSSLKAQGFPNGNVYVAGSVSAEIFEYSSSLTLISSWTHPSFGTAGQGFQNGPEGMVFDPSGNLVVAARDSFCVFSSPGVLLNCYPKFQPEPTENIIYDNQGNIYTTTSSGSGTNRVHKYDLNFNYVSTFLLPSGQLTGITCDTLGQLYIVSLSCTQGQSCIYILDGQTLIVQGLIDGIQGVVDDIQYTNSGNLLITRFGLQGGTSAVTRIQDSPPLTILNNYPLPVGAGQSVANTVTIDNAGNIYVGDFNSGNGQPVGDLFVLDSSGNVIHSLTPGTLRGPWGTAVAGVDLPCGANNIIIPTLSEWGFILLGLIILSLGALAIWKQKFDSKRHFG